MTSQVPDISLEAIRRNIDAIDDGLLDLMIRRLAATAQVRSSKAVDGSLNASPFRPAREAQMLRRLVAEGQGRIDPQFVVRLWRVILSSSIQEQAPVCLHLDHAISEDVEVRAELAAHFCGFRIVSHQGIAGSVAALAASLVDLAIVKTGSAWADAMSGGAVVIGALPVLKQGDIPRLLILGHAAMAPSGDDETILLSNAPLALNEAKPPRWQLRSGAWHVTCLAGFDTPHHSPGPNIRVAGRYPAPIEVSP